jgi:hypothetical protein
MGRGAIVGGSSNMRAVIETVTTWIHVVGQRRQGGAVVQFRAFGFVTSTQPAVSDGGTAGASRQKACPVPPPLSRSAFG